MRRTVEEAGLDADERVARHDTELHGVLDAGVHAGDVLPRDAATGDLVVELVELPVGGVHGLDGHLDLGVLARPTRLLLVDGA